MSSGKEVQFYDSYPGTEPESAFLSLEDLRDYAFQA